MLKLPGQRSLDPRQSHIQLDEQVMPSDYGCPQQTPLHLLQSTDTDVISDTKK